MPCYSSSAWVSLMLRSKEPPDTCETDTGRGSSVAPVSWWPGVCRSAPRLLGGLGTPLLLSLEQADSQLVRAGAFWHRSFDRLTHLGVGPHYKHLCWQQWHCGGFSWCQKQTLAWGRPEADPRGARASGFLQAWLISCAIPPFLFLYSSKSTFPFPGNSWDSCTHRSPLGRCLWLPSCLHGLEQLPAGTAKVWTAWPGGMYQCYVPCKQ